MQTFPTIRALIHTGIDALPLGVSTKHIYASALRSFLRPYLDGPPDDFEAKHLAEAVGRAATSSSWAYATQGRIAYRRLTTWAEGTTPHRLPRLDEDRVTNAFAPSRCVPTDPGLPDPNGVLDLSGVAAAPAPVSTRVVDPFPATMPPLDVLTAVNRLCVEGENQGVTPRYLLGLMWTQIKTRGTSLLFPIPLRRGGRRLSALTVKHPLGQAVLTVARYASGDNLSNLQGPFLPRAPGAATALPIKMLLQGLSVAAGPIDLSQVAAGEGEGPTVDRPLEQTALIDAPPTHIAETTIGVQESDIEWWRRALAAEPDHQLTIPEMGRIRAARKIETAARLTEIDARFYAGEIRESTWIRQKDDVKLAERSEVEEIKKKFFDPYDRSAVRPGAPPIIPPVVRAVVRPVVAPDSIDDYLDSGLDPDDEPAVRR